MISPEIVGVANVENASPRSGSNRSTAFSSPSVAICSRSSTASPRPANRRASAIARPRCSEISSSRSRRSLVRRYSKNRASVSSCACRPRHPSGTRLEQPEPPLAVDGLELVLVDHRGDDRAGELGRRELTPPVVRAGALDLDRVVAQREDEVERDSGRPPVIVKPSSSTAMRRSSRSSNVMPDPAAGIGRGQARQAQELRERRESRAGSRWRPRRSCLQTGQAGNTESDHAVHRYRRNRLPGGARERRARPAASPVRRWAVTRRLRRSSTPRCSS